MWKSFFISRIQGKIFKVWLFSCKVSLMHFRMHKSFLCKLNSSNCYLQGMLFLYQENWIHVSSCVSGRQIPPLDPHENSNNGAIKLGRQTSQTGRRCCWPNLIFLDLLEKQICFFFSLRKDFVISVTWLLILKAVISTLPMSSNARTRSRRLYFKGILQNPVGKSFLISCQNYNVKVLRFSVWTSDCCVGFFF